MKEKLIKNKKIVIGLAIGLIAVIFLFIFFNNVNKDNPLELKEEIFYVEYGEMIATNIDEYVDITDYDEKTQLDILDNSVLVIDLLDESDKEYPSVGEYDVTITYNKNEIEFKVIVRDTTPPTIGDFDSPLETYLDVIPDYESILLAIDLSREVIIEIDDSNIDYSVVGEYIGKITVKDIYDNIYETEFTVVIKEKENEEDTGTEQNKSTTTNNSGNTTNTSGSNTNSSNDSNSSSSGNNTTGNNSSNSSNTTTCSSTPTKTSTGGSGFVTEADAIAYYNEQLNYWANKHSNGEITWEEYGKNCPSGYETWGTNCNWNISFYFR